MHWLDTRENKLIVGDAAYESTVTNSFPGDIVPLIDILESYEPLVTSDDILERSYDLLEFTPDDVRSHCQWILGVLATRSAHPVIKTRHITRLSSVGLGPSIPFVKRQLGVGSMHELGAELGFEKPFSAPGTYSTMELSDFIEYAQSLTNLLGRKPRTVDYDEAARLGQGPSAAVIKNSTGYYVSQLNDMIGFPATKRKSRDDFIRWGAEVRQVNDIDHLTRFVINSLAARKRGPGQTTIVRHFTSLSEFNRIIDEQSLTIAAESATSDYYQALEQLPAYLKRYIPTDEAQKELFAVKLTLVNATIPQLSVTERVSIAHESTPDTLIEYLMDEDERLSVEHIVHIARSLGCYQLIWGPRVIQSPLYVTEEELEDRHVTNRAASKKYHTKKQSKTTASEPSAS